MIQGVFFLNWLGSKRSKFGTGFAQQRKVFQHDRNLAAVSSLLHFLAIPVSIPTPTPHNHEMNSQHFCSLFHCTGLVPEDGCLTMIYQWFAFLLFLALQLLE